MKEIFRGPVGSCIYCDSRRYNERTETLHEEHVIPLALNGRMVLREASCERCERKINKFETPCNKKLFGPVRYWMALKSRKPKERPTTLPVILKRLGLRDKKVEVPIADYPVTIALMVPDMPSITGASTGMGDREIIIAHPISTTHIFEQKRRIAQQFRAQECITISQPGMGDHRKLVAKIGHSFASAVMGVGTFRPLLRSYILGESEDDEKGYIGISGQALSKTDSLHEIWMDVWTIDRVLFLVVHVRLFARWFSHDFVAIVGEISASTFVPKDVYSEPNP